MKLLGIDYGLHRIGMAVSEGSFASPLGKTDSLDSIVRIAREQGVEKIVVGLPDPHNQKIKDFGNRLSELSGVPVEYFDETLSTKEARAQMIAAGTSSKKRREEIDQNAAAVILQSYLDSQDLGEMPL